MKLHYLLFTGIALSVFNATPLEDPSSQKRNRVTKFFKSWDDLAQESKNRIYEKSRDLVLKALPSSWTWENITKPQVEATNNYYGDLFQKKYSEAKKTATNAGLWAAGIAAVGGAAYGLYRWANNRGLSGITNDFLEIDKRNASLLHQITQKINMLTTKKSLSQPDRSLGKGLLMLIGDNVQRLQQNVESLQKKAENLKEAIKPHKENLSQKEDPAPGFPSRVKPRNSSSRTL